MRVVDFALCAMDEIVNQAAKNRYMFGGQGRVPLVRAHADRPVDGIGGAALAVASRRGSRTCPALVVVAPAHAARQPRPAAARALDCDDPVVYLEHKELWGAARRGASARHRATLGQARALRAPAAT